MSNILDKAKELLDALKAEQAKRKLKGQEIRLVSKITYFLIAEGVKVKEKVKVSKGSIIAKQFSQQTRESQMYEGGLAASKDANKESKENPQKLKQELEEEQLLHEQLLEEEEAEKNVLATSEKKPKRSNRRKKTED